MSFGAHVRTAREGAGISQGELGLRVGVSGVQISRIESGKRGASTEVLVAIAVELNISLDLLKPDAPGAAGIASTDREVAFEDAPTVT